MRHTLGILLASASLLLTTGCGADTPGGDVAQEPSGPTTATSEAAEPVVLDILSQTAAGGETTDLAIDLSTPAGVEELVGPVSRGGLDDQVRHRVAEIDVPQGQRLVGAVVNVGCDVPSDVTVTVDGDDVLLEPVFTGDRLPECLAAVTSIALVLVAS
ncbi:hypothetical protein [Nocardioides sp.]|uniref:hypothetical protein n=1 Tax=Nocardioides sp. TaxID=35761 RepID=UPI003D09C7E8